MIFDFPKPLPDPDEFRRTVQHLAWLEEAWQQYTETFQDLSAVNQMADNEIVKVMQGAVSSTPGIMAATGAHGYSFLMSLLKTMLSAMNCPELLAIVEEMDTPPDPELAGD